MTNSCALAIVGLGAMGSATVAALSRRGFDVIGFDRHRPPHDQGSSHGKTRIIRKAYWEHPLYVPLVQSAFDAWRELERRSSRELLVQTGALLIGREEGLLIRGTRQSAVTHDLEFEDLSRDDIVKRFPHFRPSEDTVGLFEREAGILFPEDCIEAFLNEAAEHGARLRFEEAITEWKAESGTVHLQTTAGSYSAERLLIAAGPWTRHLVPDLPLEVERQVMHWFEPKPESPPSTAEHLPVFLFEEADEQHWYGVPDFGDGVKVAIHHNGELTTVDALQREVAPADVEAVRALLEQRMPMANGRALRACVCMYTNTPDGHFLIDSHPLHEQVLIASPCSGHGFKFASIFGEILADLLTTGETSFDLSPFRLSRDALSTHERTNEPEINNMERRT